MSYDRGPESLLPPQSPGYGPPQGRPPAGWAPPPSARPRELASWGRRGAAALLDTLFQNLTILPGLVLAVVALESPDDGEDVSTAVLLSAGVLVLAAIAVQVWQQGWRQGKRGQSWGKQIVGIHLVSVWTGAPPGGGVGLGRFLLRIVLGSCSQGIYTVLTQLWPLWDQRSQTLDDKIFKTLVVKE